MSEHDKEDANAVIYVNESVSITMGMRKRVSGEAGKLR